MTMELLDDRIVPTSVLIGFRVECRDLKYTHTSQQQVELGPNGRNRRGSLTTECNISDDLPFFNAAEYHFVQKELPSPFTSLFRSWESALRRREWRIKHGALNVVIIAIWLKHRVVYDAEGIAKYPGFVVCPTTTEEETRPLEPHIDEILITGGIPAYPSTILASFGGPNYGIETVSISPLINDKRQLMPAMIPKEDPWKSDNDNLDSTDRLANELRNRTGSMDDRKFCALVLAICGCPIRTWRIEDGRDIETTEAPNSQRVVFSNGKREYHFRLENGLMKYDAHGVDER